MYMSITECIKNFNVFGKINRKWSDACMHRLKCKTQVFYGIQHMLSLNIISRAICVTLSIGYYIKVVVKFQLIKYLLTLITI